MGIPIELKKSLSYLILGQKGGQKRIEIIDMLKDRPYNTNQLAQNLNLNYRTVRHHIDALLKHDVITTSKTGGYGEVFFLTPNMEEYIALFEDMKKMMNEVTSSPQLFRTLLEQTNDAVVIINKDREVMFWNDSSAKLYGYDEEEVMGTELTIFEDEEFLHKKQKMALKGKKVVGVETKLKHKSGNIINALVTIDAIRNKDDSLFGFSIIVLDITERKRAEDALREARDNLERRVGERTSELELAKKAIEAERKLFLDALDTLPAYLVLLTPDYHVSFANKYFRDRFGESQGRKCFEYLFKRNEPCEDCKTYDTLKKMAPLEWEWLGPDDRNYQIYDFPFKDTDGSTLIMEVGFDITESKKANK